MSRSTWCASGSSATDQLGQHGARSDSLPDVCPPAGHVVLSPIAKSVWRVYYDTEAYYREGTADARRMCEQAIQIDPEYARAYACLGTVNLFNWMYRGRTEDLDHAVDCARTAVGLDDSDDYCLAALGGIHLKRAEHDLAEFHLRKAVALNPNDADTICYMGIYLVYAGQALQAIEWFEGAMRRNPLCPDLYHESLGMAQYLAHRFEDGVASLRRIRKLSSWGRAYLAACYAQLGHLDAARAEIAEYIREAGFHDKRTHIWRCCPPRHANRRTRCRPEHSQEPDGS